MTLVSCVPGARMAGVRLSGLYAFPACDICVVIIVDIVIYSFEMFIHMHRVLLWCIHSRQPLTPLLLPLAASFVY